MLASITPLGERGRDNRFAITATAYVVGATLGGLTLGALAGVVGRLVHPSATVAVVGVALVALAAVVADLAAGAGRLPTIHRQVNEDWLTAYRGWVYGVGFGYQLGFGVVTIVTTAAVYAAVADAVLTASVVGGALVGLAFGLVRGLTIFLGVGVERPDQLNRVHSGFASRARVASRATVVVQALVFGAVATVLLGAS